ncbi:MAG: tetratricopeptide repeat protein, partial [Chitinivibrionales bacterium]
EVTIVHTGYADKAMVYRKSLRNKELLQLELACEHDSTDPTLLMNMGDCHLKLGERGDAQTCYARICAQPDAYHRNSDVFVQAHINLATLYMKEGRCREASRFLLRSLFLDPTRTESHLRLGKIYLKRGMHRKAADHFLKAARIHPPLRLTASNTTMVRLNAIWHLADIYIQAGHYQEAETVLEAALQSYPQVPRFYSQRGDIRRLSGDLVQAARYYSQALTLSPTCNEQAYLGMAAVYRSLGDLSTARTFLTRGLSFHPQSGELRDALEAVADRRGQLQTV